MSNKALKSIFMAAVLGTSLVPPLLLVDEAPPREPPPRSEAQIVDDICASDKPRLVVDFFGLNKPDFGVQAPYYTVDVDGDYISDMAHGDIVAKVAEFSGQKILTFGLKTDSKKMDRMEVAEDFKTIVAMLRSGKIPPVSAISFSVGMPIDIAVINSFFHERSASSGERGIVITPDNIGQKKGLVIARFQEKAAWGDEYAKGILEAVDSYNDLQEMDIPLITAAGNQYSSSRVNLNAIFGGISVGALTHDGKEIAPYSNANSITHIYRIGDFISRKVPGGVDINNDGVVDFPDAVLSAKPLGSIKFESVGTYGKGKKLSAEMIGSWSRNYGDYVYDGHKGFRKQQGGKITFDPAGTGDPSQVAIITGTSLAAPNICGR